MAAALLVFVGYTFYAVGYFTCLKDVEQGREVLFPRAKPNPSKPGEHIYYFPVQPPEYGNYQADRPGDHHDYPAADIFAPFGAVVVAVSDGIIEWMAEKDEWIPEADNPATRGGLAFALKGDDGVRYYAAHLSRFAYGIKRGMRVRAGQVIGYIGKSGNARFTPPHLHFGISRLTTPDDWMSRRGEVWPGPYLDAWKKGSMLTPKLPETL